MDLYEENRQFPLFYQPDSDPEVREEMDRMAKEIVKEDKRLKSGDAKSDTEMDSDSDVAEEDLDVDSESDSEDELNNDSDLWVDEDEVEELESTAKAKATKKKRRNRRKRLPRWIRYDLSVSRSMALMSHFSDSRSGSIHLALRDSSCSSSKVYSPQS